MDSSNHHLRNIVFANDTDEIIEKVIAYNVVLLFVRIQVVLSFGCVLTKPDARQLICDLLTLKYCRGYCQRSEKEIHWEESDEKESDLESSEE